MVGVPVSGIWVGVLTVASSQARAAVMPQVIEPETFGTEDAQVPPVLWTPTAAPLREGQELTLVLRELADGQRVMLVFTSFDALLAGCGPKQPYVSFRSEGLQEFQAAAEADVVLWDAVLAPAVHQQGDLVTGEA